MVSLSLPRPYYQDHLVTIYHADFRQILPSLAPNSVDLVLTDPPYGINYQSKRKGSLVPTSVRGDDSLNDLRAVLPLSDALLKHDRHAYVFAAPTKLGQAMDAMNDFWRLKNVLVWDKGNAGTRGDLTAGFANNWEAILYGSKGRRPLIGPRPRCVYRHDWQASRDPVHPTVKPVGMMSWLIAKSTDRGELVLDPFTGSGVVLRAAAELGRRAIGIDVEECHCETAARRVSASITT